MGWQIAGGGMGEHCQRQQFLRGAYPADGNLDPSFSGDGVLKSYLPVITK